MDSNYRQKKRQIYPNDNNQWNNDSNCYSQDFKNRKETIDDILLSNGGNNNEMLIAQSRNYKRDQLKEQLSAGLSRNSQMHFDFNQTVEKKAKEYNMASLMSASRDSRKEPPELVNDDNIYRS